MGEGKRNGWNFVVVAAIGSAFLGAAEPAFAKPVSARGAILSRADRAVRLRTLRRATREYRDDCSGFVRWSYDAGGVDVMPATHRAGDNGVTSMYRKARSAGALHWRTPKPGDLVFFRETYDWNRDGRRNDGLTHVGIVRSVDKRGTVTYVHRSRQGIIRSHLNVRRPRLYKQNGVVWNDYARRAEAGRRGYLSGELFAGYASADRLRRVSSSGQAAARKRRASSSRLDSAARASSK